MEENQILDEVTTIFRDELENDRINLTRETTAKDIVEWDSLTNIRLVVAIEKHFKIRFTSQEIQGWKNVGEMVGSIMAKRT